MKKPPEVYFKHMLLAIQEIESYIDGYSHDQFSGDNKTISAVVRQLEIIGEAAGKIPKSACADSPTPFRLITGMRHKLIHDYLGVDVDIVWKTITGQIVTLKKYLTDKLRR